MIGKEIRLIRKEDGISGKELCAKLGISSASLTNIEHDDNDPKFDLFIELIDYFDAPADVFFIDEDEKFLDYAICGYFKKLSEKNRKKIKKIMIC